MISPAHKIELRDVSRSVSVRRIELNPKHTPTWVVVVTHTAQKRSGQVISIRRFESLSVALGFAAEKLAET
jgi:hypothetical protein